VDFAPLAVAIALMWKVVDFVKLLRVRDWNGVVTQAAVWGAGVGTTFLLAHTDFSSGIKIADLPLASLNASTLVLLGLSLGSTASVLYDGKRALDRSDSAAMPGLLSGEVPIVPPATVDADDSGEIGALLLVIILLALLFGGLGFALHVLWWVALICLVVFFVGLLTLS
jgi:hypothetical protein